MEKGYFKKKKKAKRILSYMLAGILAVGAFPTCSFAMGQVPDNFAKAILGENLVEEGLKLSVGDVDSPVATEYEGTPCWVLDPTIGNATRFIYVDVDDRIAKQLTDGTNFEVSVEYMDKGYSSLTLEYPYYDINNNLFKPVTGTTNGNAAFKRELDYLEFTDTNKWKTHTWLLQAPAMRNSMNKSDFRIGVYSDTMGFSLDGPVYIKGISVKKLDNKDQMGIDIDSDMLGNIFYTGENMDFEVSFNPGENKHYERINQSYKAKAIVSLMDIYGKTIHQKTEDIEIEPNQITKLDVSFKVETYGLYTVKAEFVCEEKKLYSEYHERCSYVRSEKGKIVNEKSGVSIPTALGGELGKWHADIISNAGFAAGRMNYAAAFSIGSMSRMHMPTNVAIRPVYYEFINELRKKGIEVSCYFSSENTIIGKDAQIPNTDDTRKTWYNTEERFIDSLYDSIYLWETLNEPNFRQPQKADINVKDTADLVKYSVPKLKENYPDLIIGGPQLGHVANKYNWVGQFIDYGAMDCLDAYTLHMYTWDGDPISLNWWTAMNANGSTLEELVDLFESKGMDKEIYVTEYGYSAFHQACHSEWQQACWNIQNTFELLKNDFSDRNFIFRIDNKGVNKRTEREHNFGLVRSVDDLTTKDPGAAKEQYLAFSNFNHEMYDAVYKNYYPVSENTECMHFYKTGTQEDVLTLFTNKTTDVVHLDLGTNSLVYMDIYGNAKEIKSIDGTYTFPVSEAPCFIKGKFGKCEFVENTSVMPEAVSVAVDYNSEYEFKIAVPQNTDFDVVTQTIHNSEVEVVDVVKDETGAITLKIKTGDCAPKGKEPLMLTIKDGEDVYFYGNIILDYAAPVKMYMTTGLKADGSWVINAELTNVTAGTVSGSLSIVSPEEWKTKVSPQKLSLAGGETKTVEFVLPENCENWAEKPVDFAFFVDGRGDDSAIYYSKMFDFVAVKQIPDEMAVDGKLDDWNDAKWINFDKTSQFVEVHGFKNIYNGLDDVRGKMALMWDNERLYIAADIEDDALFCDGEDPSRMWSLDSLQFAIVYDPDDRQSSTYFVEIACGLFNGVPTAYRHKNIINGLTDYTAVEGIDMAIVREGTHTKYEISVPWYSMFETRDLPYVEKGQEFKFSAIINENDTGERKGYYEFGSGIGSTKNNKEFRAVSLSE